MRCPLSCSSHHRWQQWQCTRGTACSWLRPALPVAVLSLQTILQAGGYLGKECADQGKQWSAWRTRRQLPLRHDGSQERARNGTRTLARCRSEQRQSRAWLKTLRDLPRVMPRATSNTKTTVGRCKAEHLPMPCKKQPGGMARAIFPWQSHKREQGLGERIAVLKS